jgi:hypothetical protein
VPALCLSVVLITGVCHPIFTESLPDWFLPLRDAVYAEEISADAVIALYDNVVRGASNDFLLLSRAEYFAGRALQAEGRKKEAVRHYDQGMVLAWKSLKGKEKDLTTATAAAAAGGYLLLAENISQLCAVNGMSYALFNGLKVETYSREVLKRDSRNAAALYLIAARYVYAPSPFYDYERGITMMTAIYEDSAVIMDKDDRFNVCSALSFAYMRQKKPSDARRWAEAALGVYPTNKYARKLLDGTADAADAGGFP